jgi:hypothetical protein
MPEELNITPETETPIPEEIPPEMEEPLETPPEETPPEEITEEDKGPEPLKIAPKPGTPEYTKEVQKRIDQITREKYEQKRRADALERKLTELETTTYVPPRPTRPDPDNFKDDYGALDTAAYNAAFTKYEDSLFDWREKTTAVERQKKSVQETRQANMVNFTKQAEALRETHTDFDAALNEPVFTPDVQDAIFDSEHGAEIAYFLGKNKTEAVRIGNLPLAKMLIEFGKLENRFSAKPGKKVSNAPRPITPLKGEGVETDLRKSPQEMSAAEYLAAKRAGLIKE